MSSATQKPDNIRRRDPQEKRQRLLVAAKKLFQNQGFDATSTAQVAKVAGVSEGILFHHFGSKKGLFESLAREFAQAAAEATMPESPEQLTEEGIVRSAFDFADANPALYDMLQKGSGELSALDLQDQNQILVNVIRDRLARAMIEGQVRQGDPDIMAQLQFAMVDAAYRAWRLSGQKNQREAYIEEAVCCMQAMLTPVIK